MAVWRVGYYSAPCDFPPHHLYGWSNRFDDPNRKYRTLYCADKKKTCLREVLADFRPNIKAIKEFRKFFGPGTAEEQVFGKVPLEWRQKNVLVEAKIQTLSGTIVNVEEIAVRKRLEKRLFEIMKKERIQHLYIKELRSKKRHITQCISRVFFDDGYAVIKFHSHLDGLPCYALFEFRSKLNQIGVIISLSNDITELTAVCLEFGLRLY